MAGVVGAGVVETAVVVAAGVGVVTVAEEAAETEETPDSLPSARTSAWSRQSRAGWDTCSQATRRSGNAETSFAGWSTGAVR